MFISKFKRLKKNIRLQSFYFYNCLHIKGQPLVSDYCEEPDQLVFEILEKYIQKNINSNPNAK